MAADHLKTAPGGHDWESISEAPVTLRMTAADASRIVRALEATSLSLCGSPSGSRLASSYMRLAADVRRQARGAPVAQTRP